MGDHKCYRQLSDDSDSGLCVQDGENDISAGAYTVWGILLKHNPVSRVSILGFMNPVLSVLLSAVFLGENREAFSLTGLLALVLVSLGIVAVNKS